MRRSLAFLCGVAALIVATPAQGQIARRVVVIGIDGLGAYTPRPSENPSLDGLRKRGAWTMHARGVMPTSSSPNWASMIMGAGPEQHGVTSNDWEPDAFDIPPSVSGPGAIFPTIFSLLREQRPSAKIGCFHDWDDFGRLLERKAVDRIEDGDGPDDTVARAVRYIRSDEPDFLFVQLDHVDHTAHERGYGTKEFYTAVAQADRLIGDLLGALEEAGILDETAVLVTADHGFPNGSKKHGGNTPAELEITWMVAGPGVRAGHEIETPVNTFDTAATIAWIFQLDPPEAWLGRPVLEAFDESAARTSAQRR
ncbi:MAG: sulfatase-like hydrolase/transferase [Luteitalea sp.]|nr:sulfatase-like hydrolase/transferase [Luteitalea sp.]